MKMKCLVLALTGLILLSTAIAQKEITPLKVGDSIPNLYFREMMNYHEQSAYLSDLYSDLLVLDFNTSSCTGCINYFPTLVGIRKKNPGRFSVVLVSLNPPRYKEENNQMFARYQKKHGYKLDFPLIFNDSSLMKLFPTASVPKYVWIRAGRVVAITGSKAVTAESVEAILNNIPVKLPLVEEILVYDPNRSILDEANGGSNKRIHSGSVLIKGELVGALTGVTTMEDSLTRRTTITNQVLPALYRLIKPFSANRILLEVKDPSKYAGEHASMYTYEVSLPPGTTPEYASSYMIDDLNRKLGIHGRWEKRRLKCWVIRWVHPGGFGDRSVDVYDTLAPRSGFRPANDTTISGIFRHQPLATILFHLNTHQVVRWPALPVFIDGTGYQGLLSITFPDYDVYNIPALDKAFRTIGMNLVEEERELDMFVITEPDYK